MKSNQFTRWIVDCSQTVLHISSVRFRFITATLLMTFTLGLFLMLRPPTAQGLSSTIVISQIYGGGGNAGTTLRNDFIELFNRGNTPVSLNGWSVQYRSAAPSSATLWQKTDLTNVTLQPGQYYLVQEAAQGGGTTNLPTPDATGSIPMAAGAGQVALLNVTTLLPQGTACPSGATLIDFVGYGSTATCSETSPTANLSNTTAALRGSNGCTETDNNSTNFSVVTPIPRNTSSPINSCFGVIPTCVTDLTAINGSAGSANLSATDSDGVVTSAMITGITPSDPGTITLTNFVAAASAGGTATATLNISNTTPIGGYSVTVLWSNNDSTPQTASCTVAVQVVALTPIHDIQGAGTSSPLANGTAVTTRGIVTALKSNGFFLQDPNVDANTATSEGIFVFTSSAPPAAATVGNLVNVSGTVQEFISSADPFSPPLTEISGSPTVSVISTGNPLPAPIILTAADTSPSGSIEQLERFEGMRVQVSSLTVISPTDGSITESSANGSTNGVFYGVITGIARPFREPGIQAPDPAPSGSIPPIPRFDANPERLRVDSDAQPGSTALNVATDAVVTGLVGPLDYAFRTYSILPDPSPAPMATGGKTPTAVPTPAANAITIASYNLQRLYDTVDDSGTSDVVVTMTAYNNRLHKASLGIRNFLRTPDILGIVEAEKLSVLQDLATKINNDAVAAGDPNPLYQAYLVEGNDIGGIDVGFLVKTAIVTGSTPRVFVCPGCVVQEGAATTITNPDNTTSILNDRPPLRLNAVVNFANGVSFPVTVIVNHLRSLTDVDSTEPGSSGWATTGARVRAKRLAQAEFLANLVQTRQTNDPNERIVLVGDFNAFQFNDGLVDVMGSIQGTPAPSGQAVLTGSDLVNPNLTNLIDSAPAAERYSYTFDGNAQTLDHIVVNAAMLAAISGASLEHPRINADFPVVARNDSTTAVRLSDHDPVIGYFALPECSFPSTPGDLVVSAGADCTATVTYQLPGTAGNCSAVTCTPASGTIFQLGETTVNCSTQNLSGGPVTTSFKVTVVDSQKPVIECPATQFVNSAAPIVVNYSTPTASDNCGVKSVVCAPASGTLFSLGTTPVNCVAKDNAGNTENCSFNVVVSTGLQPTFSLTDPLTCTGPGSTVVGTAGVANTGTVPQTGTVTTTLPAGLVAIPGSCVTNVGTCQIVNAQTVVWSGTLAPGQSMSYSYSSQVAAGVAGGTELCALTTAVFNNNSSSVQACTTIDCPLAGPGLPFSDDPQSSDQKAGSVLIFNLYTSSMATPFSENTRINLTNTDQTRPVAVHLFFIDGNTCSIANRYICLTPNQTMSFLLSDIDPGTIGYLVAVATDIATGCPINFNQLIGDSYVKFASGHAANLAAEAVPAIAGGLLACNSQSLTAQLNFDGVNYGRLGRTIAASGIGSNEDGNQTRIFINRIGGNLLTGAASVGNVFGVLFDDAEGPHSFSFNSANCQFQSLLTNSFPRTSPNFSEIVPTGNTGWMKFATTGDGALTGAIINFNPATNSSGPAFSQGHNLHKLTLTSIASYTIPVFPPSC